MVKIFAVLLSLAIGGISAYLFYANVGLSIVAVVFIGLGIAIATLLVQIILFFLVAFLLGLPENRKKIRTHQNGFYHWYMMLVERIIFSLFGMKRHCRGRELLSTNEDYIVIANHRSNLDNMIIDVYLKKYKMVFITKQSLLKAPIIGPVIHGNAYIALDRGNTLQEFEAFKIAHDMLTREKERHSIGIFPEGTRNPNSDNSNVQAFHPGSFRMAFKAQKPIVLIALRGTKEVNNNLLFKRHHCYLDVVEVIDYEQYKDMNVNTLAEYCHDKIQNFLEENIK